MVTITLAINGKTITCPSGTSILAAARQNNIKIPTLCDHEDLAPHGACRICLVEDEKSGRLMAACVTPAAQGQSLLTHSPQVLRHRRNIVRLMMAEHPESCIVCDKGNRCRLRGIAAELGIGDNGLYPMPNYKPLEQANPFMARDLSKCILCGKCIRADHELVVVGAIDYSLRGFRSRPCTAEDGALEVSECTFCGTCLSMCPTGALSPNGWRFVGTPEQTHLSVCGFCAVGCALKMGVAGGRVVEVHPAAQADTVNRSTLCVRGHFAHDYLNSAQRLTQPQIRKEGQLQPVAWDEALDLVAGRLTALKHEFGPGSMAFLGSSQCSNEENYLFQKIARVLIATPNIDNGGHFGGRPCLQRIDERTGGGWRPMPLANLEQAGAILVVGADPCQSLPVMSYFIKRAARKKIPLITATAAPKELDRSAAMAIRLAPNGQLPFVLALCRRMLLTGAFDDDCISRNAEGFNLFRHEHLALNDAVLSSYAGMAGDVLVRAAELLKGRRIAVIAGHEVIHHKDGPALVDELLNLLLMTGSIGDGGGGLFLEYQDNNLAGAWDMGSAPEMLPGRAPLSDEAARKHWERAWNCHLSPDPGLNVAQMVEAAESGRLKALFVMGENPLRGLPGAARVKEALSRIELVVAQDIVHTETVEQAQVVLPGAPFAEKAGSFTNIEGRVQCFEPAAAPLRDSRPDLEILAELAARLAGVKHRPTLAEIRCEIAQHVPMYAELGGSARRAWVQPRAVKRVFDPQGQGEPMTFAIPNLPEHVPAPDGQYPFMAVLAYSRFQAGGGTRTALSPRIQQMSARGAIRISPSDCRRLDVATGNRVRVSSPHGYLEREITIDPELAEGTIVIPLAFNANDALQLGTLDRTLRVRLEKIPAGAEA